VQRPSEDPGAFAWLLAFISQLLPWFAACAGLIGLWRIATSNPGGWWYLAAAGLMLIVDVLIDLVWARQTVLATDQPDLNRRAAQLVGRVVALEEALVHGRGKACVGDTVWMVEGPDAPAGAKMRIVGAEGAVLRVERA
jgi:inner membrane protein